MGSFDEDMTDACELRDFERAASRERKFHPDLDAACDAIIAHLDRDLRPAVIPPPSRDLTTIPFGACVLIVVGVVLVAVVWL